jgi:hypothetical protein
MKATYKIGHIEPILEESGQGIETRFVISKAETVFSSPETIRFDAAPVRNYPSCKSIFEKIVKGASFDDETSEVSSPYEPIGGGCVELSGTEMSPTKLQSVTLRSSSPDYAGIPLRHLLGVCSQVLNGYHEIHPEIRRIGLDWFDRLYSLSLRIYPTDKIESMNLYAHRITRD